MNLSNNLIFVTRPLGLPEERVEILNYRKSTKCWEPATVLKVSSEWVIDDDGGVDLVNTYSCLLDAKSKSGNDVVLHLDESKIRKL